MRKDLQELNDCITASLPHEKKNERNLKKHTRSATFRRRTKLNPEHLYTVENIENKVIYS